ncbi:NleE/OspZ family T3SS effector cysteine methyltransferase [Pectobacterium versatile]|uniref:NleE/OspZ family T3SS effector cysteine methyltransferase n=1 Tax=Pectobacterium versatile TaxID=2488639 RepID=UPI002961F07C|nr:NleE/OspZ family T3SS effector cysteine methyltransferase [Pectobacterium versatile]
MKISNINVKNNFFPAYTNTVEIIKSIYPDIKYSFFSEKPNVYDQNYITGKTREFAIFKIDEYINKKAAMASDVTKIYAEYQINSTGISPDEANTREKSWGTVISGKRPMGVFSVDSLYSPELHTVIEFPNIGCKISPKEKNEFIYIIIIYRKDCEQGERYASRFIELYDKKREIMDSLVGEQHEMKVIKSELVVAREMGALLSYFPEEIDNYMHKLNTSFSQESTASLMMHTERVVNESQCNPRHKRIVIGCGELHKRIFLDEGTHIGEHLQCDTLDIDLNMGSNILADITLPLHRKMHNNYSAVMCEALPPEVYGSDVFYNNLKLMTKSEASFVFSGLTKNTKEILTEKLKYHRLNFSETESILDLPQSLLLDEELFWNMKLEYSEKLRKHRPIIAKK